MAPKAKRTLVAPLVEAKEWIALKAEKQKIESRLEQLKEVLEPFLEKEPSKSCELAGFKFSIVQTSRENFSLSKAKEKIDGRVLAPYITTSTYNQIRTIWKGGEDAQTPISD